MKFRSARTLVYSRAGDQLLACNFLTKSVFECSVDLIAFLGELGDWQAFDDIVQLMPDMTQEELRGVVDQLVETSALLVQGSALAETEEEFHAAWKWGIPTAMMHFCVQDPDHITLAESEALQLRKAANGPLPVLYTRNGDAGTVQQPSRSARR